MLRRQLIRLWAVLAVTSLAGCGSQPSSSSPAATAVPPAAATVAPSAAPAAATAQVSAAPGTPSAAPAAATPGIAAIPESLTPEGYHVLGRPDAPVTLVMYSDFL